MKDNKKVHVVEAHTEDLAEVGAIIAEALNKAQMQGHGIDQCLATMTYTMGFIIKQLDGEIDWEASVISVFPGMKLGYDEAPPPSEEQQRLAKEHFRTKTKKHGGFNGH